MVVVMIENVYPVRNEEERIAGRSRKLPRNIRACGQSGGALPVYMEDYVGTYIRRLTESGFPECSAVVLVGQVMETEIGRCLFVRGAINASGICEGDRPVFGEDIWNEVYEKIRLYFPCDEVVGWCVAGPGFRLLQEDAFLRAHIDNFADSEKIFCCYESLEKELVLRICEGGSFRILPGYYVYYEKNDEMQNYMLEEVSFVRKTQREEQDAKENETVQGSDKVKNMEEMKKKKAEKTGSIRKDVLQLAAIACIIIVIVSVMVGTDTLSKLKESVFASGEDVSGDQLASDETLKEEEETENPEEFAFGDFDFLDEKEENPELNEQTQWGQENRPTEESAEQKETIASEKEEDRQQETESIGQREAEDEAERETVARTEPEEPEQQAAEQTGQEEQEEQTTVQVGQTEEEQAEPQRDGEEEQTGAEDPDYIEEETVTVLSPTEYTRYIVKSGDTLAKVCKEVYGSVELLYYVCELNQLKDVDSIYVGQELILPKK